MHSSRLFLKRNNSLSVNVLFKQVSFLNCRIWNHTSTSNFASCATTVRSMKVLRVCSSSNDWILGVSSRSEINSTRKFFTEVPQYGMLHIPQKMGAKASGTLQNKSATGKTDFVKKSKDSIRFGDMEDFVIEDTFRGKLGEESNFHEDSEIFVPLDRKYRSPYDYLRGMKVLIKEKKLKQALALLLDMKRHLVPPVQAHYTVLIGACGRAGYTEMAFKLLRQMTEKGFKPTSATLTGLFNSCAESPDPCYGLKKAVFLKEKILLKPWEATVPTYHAMIKAFGRCGDIKTAFEVVDEMIESGCRVSVETYNTLMIACISDKDAGFTHAIEVWRKMISKKLHPDIYSYNLLLRAVRDCGVGPEEVSCNLLHHWSRGGVHLFSDKKKTFSHEDVLTLPYVTHENTKLLPDPVFRADRNGFVQKNTTSAVRESKVEHEVSSVDNDAGEYVAQTAGKPSNLISHAVLSLLSPRPVTGPKFIDLEKMRSPANRLFLIGGVEGFLELMRKDKVAPDIKTFTMLLRIIPNSTVCENQLLELIESHQLKPDIDFFNILIKKRNFRKDFRASKEVLVLLTKKGLSPNIVTFGVLALGCFKKNDGLQLLHDMKSLGFCPNIEIFGALLNSASRTIDLEYICTLIKAMTAEQIKPNLQLLQMLEDIKNIAHDKIVAVEHHKESAGLHFSEKLYDEFCQLYEQWLKTTDVEEQADPWLQFKTEITDVYQ